MVTTYNIAFKTGIRSTTSVASSCPVPTRRSCVSAPIENTEIHNHVSSRSVRSCESAPINNMEIRENASSSSIRSCDSAYPKEGSGVTPQQGPPNFDIYQDCQACGSSIFAFKCLYKHKVSVPSCKFCLDWKSQSEIIAPGSPQEITRISSFNKGDLSSINEENPSLFVTSGVHTYCKQCDSSIVICNDGTLFVLSTDECQQCAFESQAFLTSDARSDVYNKGVQINKWVFEGEHHGKSFLSHYVAIPSRLNKYFDLLEDVCLLMHHMLSSPNSLGRNIAIVNFCKLRGNRMGLSTILLTIAGNFLGAELSEYYKKTRDLAKVEKQVTKDLGFTSQAGEDEQNIFADLRSYLSCYDKMKSTSLYKKVYKFMLYVLSMGLLDNIHIDFESMNFSKMEAAAVKATHRPGVDMVHCMLDTVCFVCERGLIYFRSGDATTLMHSGHSYEDWVVKANKLLRSSKIMSNPEPHGINKFSFLSDVKDLIEKGDAVVKFGTGLDKSEKMYVQKILNDLKMLEVEEISRKSAQMPRKDPFAVLLHGSSNICKSQLKQILFYHYGKIFGLPTTMDYMYTRCPTDEYWSGFNSTQWCIVMDDIAFLKPNKEVDPTLKEMLQVKNSVPYTPPQAALEDKGRTPVRAELLIGTTNTKHLNLYAYFACPFAIARRMSYVISAKVKPDYTKLGFMADSQKIPITEDGEYMNIWTFEVSIPVPQSEVEIDSQQTKYVVKWKFEDINDLLVWYIETAKEHEIAQNKALRADKTMSEVELCMDCYRVKGRCQCFQQQADDTPAPEPVIILPLEPSIEEIINVAACTPTLKAKLYFVQHAIMGEVNVIPGLEDFGDALDAIGNCNRWLMMLCLYLCGCSLWFFPKTSLVLSSILICAFLMHRYVWVVIHLYYSLFGGIMWKFKLAYSICGNSLDSYRLIMNYAGHKIQRQFTSKNLMALAAFISAPIFVSTLWKLYKHKIATDNFEDEKVTTFQSVSGTVDRPRSSTLLSKRKPKEQMSAQVNFGIVPAPHEVEKVPFYFHDPYINTGVEISAASKCAKPCSLDELVARNTARVEIRVPGRDTVARSTAVNIKGNIWMINKHAFKADNGSIDFIFDSVEQNVSRNIRGITFDKHDVIHMSHTDLAFIEIRAIPPGNDLTKYFPLDDPVKGCYKGKYVKIDAAGLRSLHKIVNISGNNKCPVFGVPGYFGRVEVDSANGDCGSLCVADVGGGQVLLGTHTSGNASGLVFFQHISQKMLQTILSIYKPQVDCGKLPLACGDIERTLIDVHFKSPIRYMPSGTATVYGSFEGWRPNHHSKVGKTYIHESAINHGFKHLCAKPDMSWRPWNRALTDMVSPVQIFHPSTLLECEDAFFDDIVSGLGDKIQQLEIYTQDVALNGADGVTYVDRINISTSAGAPFNKSKKFFITLDDSNKIISLDDRIQERVGQIEACYDSGKRFHPIFKEHLKDQAVTFQKAVDGKTRAMSGSEFAWMIVMRRYLLSHVRLIQNNPYVFEAMPGIVAQSTQWDKLHKYLIKFGEHKIVAGDYAKFDKKMAAPFILSAFNILERMARKAGWSEEDLRYISCMSFDTAFPCIDFNGDLIEVQGNPSGHPLTVIINCIVNSLYMRYAFKLVSGKKLKHFRRYVNLATYGDDNIMGVSDDCPLFNHTRIAMAMKFIGVEYTMADKTSESIPYIHINDTTFLKRKFIFDEDLGCVIAPLDHESIDNMMTMCVANGALAPEAHSICIIETALREYFWYGKIKFNSMFEVMKGIVEECSLQDWVRPSTFPTYDSLSSEFKERSSL